MRHATLVKGIAAAATAAAGAVAFAVPAAAADGADGRVTANGGLIVRSIPSTVGANLGTVAEGKVIPLACKVRGTAVGGNSLWYLLPGSDSGPEWVTARYVDNVGSAPDYCGSDRRYVGRATTALNERVAPTSAEARTGSYARGARLSIVCKTSGERVGGNDLWYYLTDGRWVTARYVDNIGSAPEYCV